MAHCYSILAPSLIPFAVVVVAGCSLETVDIEPIEASQSRATSLVVGLDSVCIVDDSQSLFCSNMDFWGAFGPEFELRYIPIGQIERVAVGRGCCVVTRARELYCFGGSEDNLFEIGFVFGESEGHVPAFVDLENVVDLAVGAEQACAVTAGGELYCWGSNAHGLLGVEGAIGGREPVRVELDDVIDVAAGPLTCAVTSVRELYCWGFWLEDDRYISTPQQQNVEGVRSVEIGGLELCAVLEDGHVWCRSTIDEEQGILTEVDGVVAIALGWDSRCVLRDNGALLCWGSNYGGVLGLGDEVDRDQPEQVDLDNIVSIGMNSITSAALDRSGNVYYWGALGIAYYVEPTLLPEPLYW